MVYLGHSKSFDKILLLLFPLIIFNEASGTVGSAAVPFPTHTSSTVHTQSSAIYTTLPMVQFIKGTFDYLQDIK